MRVRLRDFAETHRIAQRTVQVHIKNNIEVLESHIERRGKQGTWLDDFAVEFLLNQIQLPTKDDVQVPTAREAALIMEIANANKKLADAERRAGENAAAAGKVALLEASNTEQKEMIQSLQEEVGGLRVRLEFDVKAVKDQAEQDKAAAVEEAIRLVKEEHEDKLKKMSVWEFLKEKRRK